MNLIMIVCTDIPESFNTYEHFIPVFDYKITVLNSQHKIFSVLGRILGKLQGVLNLLQTQMMIVVKRTAKMKRRV